MATKINNVWRYVVYDAFGKCVAEYGQLADGVGGVKYVQQDWQGSVRTVTNANGFVVSRTDHQAFGGEVGYGTGQRSIDQGYNREAATRQGYGLTERDDATGLDHTWFRKNESSAGRWTSPDPYKGSMNLGDPQSFNRYSYVQNQPTNFVDPSGLNYWAIDWSSCRPELRWNGEEWTLTGRDICGLMLVQDDNGPLEPSAGSGSGGNQGQPKKKPCAVPWLNPVTDKVAQGFESGSGNEIDIGNLSPDTSRALNCLQNAIRAKGGSATVNSGYRPQAYQDHLRNVWDTWQKLRSNTDKECQALRSWVQSESQRHGMTERPASTSNHSSGRAFDVSIRGVGNASINRSAGSCGLTRGAVHAGGGHHFNY
ncbi:MAG: D-alanyl-D-alanine carboxypeptidase family protein [Acidobacteria bacterium]|nr:D-alanyl-D-alanine carboxypeptidase family protein [Acidobacteriota bacterium]